MEPEYECDSCGWHGYDLDEDGNCPDCGSSEIVDYQDDNEDEDDD